MLSRTVRSPNTRLTWNTYLTPSRATLSARIPPTGLASKVTVARVGVKAKTNEGMGLVGAGEGAAAFAAVLIEGEDVA